MIPALQHLTISLSFGEFSLFGVSVAGLYAYLWAHLTEQAVKKKNPSVNDVQHGVYPSVQLLTAGHRSATNLLYPRPTPRGAAKQCLVGS